ncbi:MAG: methylated-DNA--[protein]-cysteine S-methyltransferase [Verrucomicrobiales bacterium]|nr:methylated-DNA--[protein]-cysteine S-methyltransferase [Verrucomicrobiales bacterium]
MDLSRYFTTISSPIGDLTVTATERGLSGVYFDNHLHPPCGREEWICDDGIRFDEVKSWFSAYMKRRKPEFLPKLDLSDGTAFQQRVWKALMQITPGGTVTYQEIAKRVESPKAVRAVGAAIGRNPLSIIIPCHRVLGSDGKLTGFAGGLERKRWLLVHEGILCL